jgi:hypothetical protein
MKTQKISSITMALKNKVTNQSASKTTLKTGPNSKNKYFIPK